jgi:hypothetical protein
MLKKSIQKQKLDKPVPNWRTFDENFITNNAGDSIEPGAVTFSAGWLGQGHTVSFPNFNKTKTNLTTISPVRKIPSIAFTKPTSSTSFGNVRLAQNDKRS